MIGGQCKKFPRLLKSEYAIYDMPPGVEDEKIKELTKQFAESHLFFEAMLDDDMIGYVCFHDNKKHYDIGYCFRSDYHDKGYSYEACSATMEYITKQEAKKPLLQERHLKTHRLASCLKSWDLF